MARLLRSYGVSTLRKPAVVGAGIAFHGPRRRIVGSSLQATLPARRVHSHLSPPAVVTPGVTFTASPIRVELARIRPPKTASDLRAPAVVGPILARPVDETLAPQKRGTPKSHLSPPAVVGPV